VNTVIKNFIFAAHYKGYWLNFWAKGNKWIGQKEDSIHYWVSCKSHEALTHGMAGYEWSEAASGGCMGRVLLTMPLTSGTDVSKRAFDPEEDILNIHYDVN